MEIRPIRTDADYRAALGEVSAYFDNEPEPGTPEGDRFEVLLTLVEAYEARHFPIDLPDPVEAIKFRMEQGGLTGARQDSCHLSHAAKGCLFVLPIAMATTDSRSGLSVTGPAGDQFRVWRDQRAGWRSRASTYSA